MHHTKILSILFILYFPFSILAQKNPDKKRDYQWYFGYEYYKQGNIFDFNTTPLAIGSYNDVKFGFREFNAAICDTAGQLLFSSNACSILNKNHKIVPHSDSLALGVYYDAWCLKGFNQATRYHEGGLFLPLPNNDSIYYFFHKTVEESPSGLYSDKIYLTTLNARGNNGEAAIVDKNKVIFKDKKISVCHLKSVRHANGRDWWLTQPARSTEGEDADVMYSFLLTPDSLQGPYAQHTSAKFGTRYWEEQSCYSPDGTKYARIRSKDGLYLFDFDRSTGLYSNYRLIAVDDSVYRSGVAFSSNSRFVYVFAEKNIYQLDTKASSPDLDKTIVATWDGFLLDNFWGTTFDFGQLGPDCKIYIAPGSTIEYIHVINYPNRKGIACGVEQRAIKTPTKVSWGLPNYPHFRLGALGTPHTPCDSTLNPYLTDVGDLRDNKITAAIYPNPAQASINVDLYGYTQHYTQGSWELYNVQGSRVSSFPLFVGHDEYQFDISTIPNGFYVWRLMLDAKTMQVGKLVVAKE